MSLKAALSAPDAARQHGGDLALAPAKARRIGRRHGHRIGGTEDGAHARLELLGEARRIKDPDERLMAILRAYVVPAFVSSSGGDGGGAEFTRMRAVLSAEGNPDAQAIIADAFDETSRTFIEALGDCVPGAPLESLVWRSQFLLGGLYYALINPERVTRLSHGAVDGDDREAAVRHLVEATYASFRSLSGANPQRSQPLAVSTPPIQENQS